MDYNITYMEKHQEIESSFISFFEAKGYRRLDSVPISSHIDRSVFLVNSATNLFKPHFSSNQCLFAVQHCMRTQTLSNYYNVEQESQYPTTFDSYGAFVPVNLLCKIVADSIEYFRSVGFNLDKMRVRASDNDLTLLSALSQSLLCKSVILDEKTDKYDHKYGDGITGRAIKLDYYQEWQKKYKNLCYFILIYRGDRPIGVELATSDQLIIMRLQNKKYGISVSKIADILSVSSFEERRFADCVVGTAHLLYEGLHPNSSTTNGRTLKKYISAVHRFGTQLGYTEYARVAAIINYLEIEYGYITENQKQNIARIICSKQ